MIEIATELKASTVHGIGVFAKENIPKGTLIWSYNKLFDPTYSPERWIELKGSLSEPALARFNTYCYMRGEDRVLPNDGSQFMNHSDENYNVGSLNGDYDKVFALRDIAKGHEILCNYNEL